MRERLVSLCCLAALLGASGKGFAQSTTGSVVGTVRDDAGVLSGVTVAIKGDGIAGTQSCVTNELGLYEFGALAPGAYTLTFALAGYSTLSRPGVRISPGGRLEENVGLRVALFEDILVTARKLEETLQSVPISVAVVMGDTLREQAVVKMESLAPTIPNLHFSEAVSGNDQIFVRGVGSGVNSGFENSVGQVFDGVFVGRSRFGRSLFMDVAQIEVLKGPQGALIGKNTTAGVVNIRTARPTATLEGYLTPTWQMQGDGGYSVEGALSGPLSKRIRGRVAGRYDNKDGYVRNVSRDTKEMSQEVYGVRGIIAADLTSALTATLLYQRSDQTRLGRNREILNCSAALATALAPTGEDCAFNRTNSAIDLRNGVERDATTNMKGDLAGLTLGWSTGLGTVTSVTGYVQFETADGWDGDLTAPEGNAIDLNETYEQWSQELRLVSEPGGKTDYIVGAYYQSAEQDNDFKLHFNFQGPPPLPVFPPANRATNNRVAHQTTETAALFGQVQWRVSPKWGLTAGFRYTAEDKQARHREFATVVYTDTPRLPPPGGPAANQHAITGERTEHQVTPNGVIQWYPTENAMAYFNVGRGFKGGGFDHTLTASQANAPGRFEFEDEQVLAYELGAKVSIPGTGLRGSVAIFRSEFDNLQVSSLQPDQVGTVFKVANVAAAISEGVEAEIAWAPTRKLRLSANAAYLKARYSDFQDAACFATQTPAQGCVGGVQDLSGRELQFSPHWKAAVDARYTWRLPNRLSVVAFARAYYSDRYALTLDLDPLSFQEPYAKFDASLALGRADAKWRVVLIGQNLSDELTANFGNVGPGDRSVFRFAEPPRSFFLQGLIAF